MVKGITTVGRGSALDSLKLVSSQLQESLNTMGSIMQQAIDLKDAEVSAPSEAVMKTMVTKQLEIQRMCVDFIGR